MSLLTGLRRRVKANRLVRGVLFLAQNVLQSARSVRDRSDRVPAGNPVPRHELVAMVRVKNEARFLPEWLAHHVNIGVQHFYVYDNDSTDDTEAALERFTSRGYVTHIKWPTVPISPSSHLDFLRRFGHTTTWALFLDADEFLIERDQGALMHLLRSSERWPAIAFNSLYFGAGGHESIPAGLVTEQFDRSDATCNDHVKVVAQPRMISAYRNPHSFYYHRGRLARTPDGRRVFGTFVRTSGHLDFVVHHYLNRSREDHENKRRRGYATRAGQRAQQRSASRAESELSKYNDVTTRLPASTTRRTADLLQHLGYPEALFTGAERDGGRQDTSQRALDER